MAAAALQGATEEVEHLLARGDDPNEQHADLGLPLHLSVERGHVAVVRLLLAGGARPMLRDDRGLTAMEVALRVDNTEILRLLCERLEGRCQRWRWRLRGWCARAGCCSGAESSPDWDPPDSQRARQRRRQIRTMARAQAYNRR